MARLNPIFLREMRQAVRGRFVVGFFLLFLVAMLAATIAIILQHGQLHGEKDIVAFGNKMFEALLTVLVATCGLFVPFYTGLRLIAEHGTHNVELYFITELKPGEIIRGKTYMAGAVVLLAFSASAPFLAMTIFLRGIDVPTIIVGLVTAFTYVMLGSQIALFIGGMRGRGARICAAATGITFFALLANVVVETGVAGIGAASSMMLLLFCFASFIFHLVAVAGVKPRSRINDDTTPCATTTASI